MLQEHWHDTAHIYTKTSSIFLPSSRHAQWGFLMAKYCVDIARRVLQFDREPPGGMPSDAAACDHL
jgi:hypothetical protein